MPSHLNRLPPTVALVAAALLASPATSTEPNTRSETAPGPRDVLVVSTAWLAEHLADPDLVLLHVGDRAEYDAAHLPGARHVATRDLALSHGDEGGLILEMPPADDLRARLERLGISDGSRVVVYWGSDWISPATRILFTLDHAGLGDRASLLDGGQPAWAKEGRALTAEVAAVAPGKLSPLSLRATIVDGDFVRARIGAAGTAIVDARSPAFYSGAETGGRKESPHRTGHIASAKSVPFDSIVDGELRLLSNEALRARFDAAGVRPGDTVVTYCHIGQQATATLLAARLLGHETRLYDGSFEDWSRRADAPVEGPGAEIVPPAGAERRER